MGRITWPKDVQTQSLFWAGNSDVLFAAATGNMGAELSNIGMFVIFVPSFDIM